MGYFDRHLLFFNHQWIDDIKNNHSQEVWEPVHVFQEEQKYFDSLENVKLDTHLLITLLTVELAKMGATKIAVHPMYEKWHEQVKNEVSIDNIHQIQTKLIESFMELFSRKTIHMNQPIVDEVLNYIHINLETPLTIGDIATHLNYSRSYLSTIFSKYMGVSIQHYIHVKKIEYSEDLLKQQKRISEIAQILCFCDSSHYIKLYKKIRGVSPKHKKNPNI